MLRQRPTVLLADDDIGFTQAVGIRLNNMGFDVVTANDGESAKRVFDNALPDAVLLDVDMPGSDGFAVCQHIRDEHGAVRVPVIFLTGSDAGIIRDHLQGLTLAVDGDRCLIKPCGGEQLSAAIWQALAASCSSNQKRPETGSA